MLIFYLIPKKLLLLPNEIMCIFLGIYCILFSPHPPRNNAEIPFDYYQNKVFYTLKCALPYIPCI